MNQVSDRGKGFAKASLIMGILAVLSVFTMTIIPPMILGGLSIILGLLSRGDTRFPGTSAMIGILTSTGAIVMNIVISVFAYSMIFSNPETTQMYRDIMNETYEQTLGITFDELLENYGLGGELE